MSILELAKRPIVPFDVEDKRHRQWFAEFNSLSTWSKCPVRFLVAEENGEDLVSMIQRKMIEYYMQKEFKDIKLK